MFRQIRGLEKSRGSDLGRERRMLKESEGRDGPAAPETEEQAGFPRDEGVIEFSEG